MNKRTLTRTLQSISNSPFINREQLKKGLGYGSNRVTNLVKDVDFIEGRTRLYLCEDIASKMMDMRGRE